VRRLAWILALSLAACRVGPPYGGPPEVGVPDRHRGSEGDPAPTSLADRAWWEVFQDPALVDLLARAVRENQDLRIAAARVAEARAGLPIARSERLPQVDVEAGADRTRLSQEILTQGNRTRTSLSVGTPVSWELDLWGRVARSTDAALARWEGAQEARRDALRVVVAEVAQAYFELCGLDLELAISEDTVTTRQKTLDLFTTRFEGERGSRLEVARAAADRAGAAAQVPRIRQEIEQKENLIALLVGALPGPVRRGTALVDLALPPEVPAGLPSDLLRRRPDVRAAERDVAAAAGDVGVARTDFFPRITLTGFLGLASRDLGSLVAADAGTASLGASLLGPLFDGGLRRGNLAAAEARYCEAGATFVRATQMAFRETADALAAVRHLRDVRAEDERRVRALEEAVALSGSRYEGGLSAYFEVLDAQRELFPARLVLARTLRDQWVAVVQLYRALGGGWQ
jgi:multidrug efflux system outer membrane protein